MSVDGKRVVFTGRLTSMKRAEAAELAKAAGATVTSSVSNLTDILVVGGEGGKTKLANAPESAEQWTEDEFLAAVGGPSGEKKGSSKKKKTKGKSKGKTKGKKGSGKGKKTKGKKTKSKKGSGKTKKTKKTQKGQNKKKQQTNSRFTEEPSDEQRAELDGFRKEADDFVYMEYVSPSEHHNKYYQVERNGTSVVGHYGARGSGSPRTIEKDFDDEDEAQAYFEKLRDSKLAKGYSVVEV